LRIEVQPSQTIGLERVKHFLNVHVHCTISNLKRISKMSRLSPLKKFLQLPMILTDVECQKLYWSKRHTFHAEICSPKAKLKGVNKFKTKLSVQLNTNSAEQKL